MWDKIVNLAKGIMNSDQEHKYDDDVPKRWDKQNHKLHTLLKLDGSFEKIDTPKKIKVSLFDSQKVSVAAMLRVEERGGLWFSDYKNNYVTPRYTNNYKKYVDWQKSIDRIFVKTNIGVLSSPLGSGKTLEILSLIAKKPIPVTHTTTLRLGDNNSGLYNTNKFAHPIINVTKRVKNIIRPALIFSGRPALKQWLYAIDTQTNLKAFMINNVYDLPNFVEMLNNGTINEYDAILVKNGTVGGTTVFPLVIPINEREPINMNNSAELFNVICNLTRDKCWSRIIIDDFDQINFPNIYGDTNALFKWYVSCTRKGHKQHKSFSNFNSKYFNCADHSRSHKKEHSTIESYLYNTYTSLKELIDNQVLFTNFNVCCSDQYIKDTILIGRPHFYKYILKNPDNDIIAALGMMGDKKVTEIFEMLNGDALEEAANKAGIASANTKDIFQKILEDKYELWEKSRIILKFIKVENTFDKHHSRKHMRLNPDKTDTYGKLNLREQRPIRYKYDNLNRIMSEEKDHWFIVKTTNGKTIERVQSNLQTSICAICSCSLVERNITEDDDDDLDDFMADMMGEEILTECKDNTSKSVIMMKCCGVTLCSECGIKGSNFRRGLWFKNKQLKKEKIVGLCTNCKIEIKFDDLIFINKDFDHDKIILENLESKELVEQVSVNAPEPVKKKKKIDKLSILVDIINGITPENQKSFDKIVPGLMVGKAKLPKADKKNVKVLIFANFEGTLNKVELRLKEKKIKFHRLGGTVSQIHDAAIKYNNTNKLNVLLINSVRYCAGLNLQQTSDVIFMHKILDKTIENQTIGRAQRVGRKYKLNIHYLLYENEERYL